MQIQINFLKSFIRIKFTNHRPESYQNPVNILISKMLHQEPDTAITDQCKLDAFFDTLVAYHFSGGSRLESTLFPQAEESVLDSQTHINAKTKS